MLWTSVFILMIPWGLGWVNGYMIGGWFIHVLLSSVIQGRRSRDRMEKLQQRIDTLPTACRGDLRSEGSQHST